MPDLWHWQRCKCRASGFFNKNLITWSHREGKKVSWPLFHTTDKNKFQIVYRSKCERSNNKAFRRKHRTTSLQAGSRQILKSANHKRKNKLDYSKTTNFCLSNASLRKWKGKPRRWSYIVTKLEVEFPMGIETGHKESLSSFSLCKNLHTCLYYHRIVTMYGLTKNLFKMHRKL